ncbi:dnaJ homolog subfamily C member 1-like [Uloborus diversus]|uniref:dnaJ homolog subfamily C member 1-like n=1 Tax=Uloborus diversus TaxID=327109 RepID=UPI00240905FB|nr:dnaJ homolog subfamily C member 1-like [Uloborus diversus]
MRYLSIALIFICFSYGKSWTTEDMELFDLVENTPTNFYDVLGVDQKASQSEIRKAYRKLSTLYHPDKNKEANAEDTFRRIAAVADVLRNDERRKTYDLILKTGLPDWRVPIYYYRRVRNMGLLEMSIFLFCLATFAQYLFAWSAYWEKKYEIEEVVLSKIRKKNKNQRKMKNSTLNEDATVSEVLSTLQKPRCQDLFPVQLFYFFIHVIKSSPSYIASCRNYFKVQRPEPEEEEEEVQEIRVRPRKQVKPKVPDYSSITSYESSDNERTNGQAVVEKESLESKKTWSMESLTENQVLEFKKAMKKFPNGTLQRWEKVAAYLNCSVPEVVTMVKQMKNQQYSQHIPLSMQGVTGTENENFGSEFYENKDVKHETSGNHVFENGILNEVPEVESKQNRNECNSKPEKIWKQEEQQALEIALQKYPKDTPARWDKISDFVSTKSKEECVERFKILVQQVKKRKDKAV